MTYICPICGYPELDIPAYRQGGTPSFESCPSCGFEPGYDDDSEGYTHEQWRQKWINEGMKFFSEDYKPTNWDPKRQLLNIGIKS